MFRGNILLRTLTRALWNVEAYVKFFKIGFRNRVYSLARNLGSPGGLDDPQIWARFSILPLYCDIFVGLD